MYGLRRDPTPTASRTAGTQPAIAAATYVRACDSSVFGTLGSGWIRDSIMVGPVVFVGLRTYGTLPARWFPHGRRAGQIKVLLVVHGTEPVTVAIDDEVPAALAYDPSRWGSRNAVPLARGDHAVEFHPCGGGRQRTQFNGAFLVERPACVPVVATTEGAPPARATLSFGAGRCP